MLCAIQCIVFVQLLVVRAAAKSHQVFGTWNGGKIISLEF